MVPRTDAAFPSCTHQSYHWIKKFTGGNFWRFKCSYKSPLVLQNEFLHSYFHTWACADTGTLPSFGVNLAYFTLGLLLPCDPLFTASLLSLIVSGLAYVNRGRWRLVRKGSRRMEIPVQHHYSIYIFMWEISRKPVACKLSESRPWLGFMCAMSVSCLHFIARQWWTVSTDDQLLYKIYLELYDLCISEWQIYY